MKKSLFLLMLFSCLVWLVGCSNDDTQRDIKFSRVEIYEDENEDGRLNRGEEAKIKVFLRNDGSYTAENVEATLSVSDGSDYVEVIYDQANFHDLTPGEVDYGYNVEQTASYWSYKIRVSNDCPIGYPIEFRLSIEDDNDDDWTRYFVMTVESVDGNFQFMEYAVYEDDNENERIDRGEEAKIKVFLKNIGSVTINGVHARASLDDEYVTLLDDNAYFYNLDPNEVDFGRNVQQQSSSWSYRLSVSENCPYQHSIEITLTISDDNGNEWTESFPIVISQTQADIVYDESVIYEDDNGDLHLNPGETIKVRLFLRNSGGDKANGILAQLSSTSDEVTILYDDARFFDLEPFEEDYGRNVEQSSSNWSYQFTIDSNCPVGTDLPFSLIIYDEDGNQWNDDFTLMVE